MCIDVVWSIHQAGLEFSIFELFLTLFTVQTVISWRSTVLVPNLVGRYGFPYVVRRGYEGSLGGFPLQFVYLENKKLWNFPILSQKGFLGPKSVWLAKAVWDSDAVSGHFCQDKGGMCF